MWHEWSTLKKLIWLRKFAVGVSYILKTVTGAIVHIMDAVAGPMDALSVAVEPVQNLNGYDNPWPAGGGKNKLKVTATTQTIKGVTFTVNEDGSVSCSGNASETVVFIIANNPAVTAHLISGVSYILSGCPTGGATGSRYKMDFRQGSNYAIDKGSEATFTFVDGLTDYVVRIVIYAGYGNGLVFKPMIRLASVTDATFAPYSNICPITGWDSVTVNRTGVNWYPVSIGADYWSNFNDGSSSNNDGELIVSMAARMYSGVYSRQDAQIKKLSKYSVTASYSVNIKASVATEIFIGYAQKGNRKVQLTTEYQRFTFENFAFGINNSFNIYNGTANAVTVYLKDFQFELGSTATAYEPYQGNTYTIQLGETVYGGTLDVVNGTMKVDRAYWELGSKTWTKINDKTGVYVTTFGSSAPTPASVGVYDVADMICSCYKVGTASDVYAESIPCSIAQGRQGLYAGYWIINDATHETIGDFSSFLNGQYICYKIATPIEIPLTPEQISTLQGTNNVWSDAGDVTVTYRASAS